MQHTTLSNLSIPHIPNPDFSEWDESTFEKLSGRLSSNVAEEAPFQAIAAPTIFEGREVEIETLKERLRSEQRIVIIRGGIGGIGKTALAATIAHQMRNDFPDGVLWVRVNEANSESILISFISSFGQRYITRLRYLPSNAAKASYYRDILSKKHCLVILDNAENVEQVINLLPSAGPSKTLITTRYAFSAGLEGAYELHLTTLSSQAARRLLSELVGSHEVDDSNDFEQIVAELGCLPLAIRIAAGIIRALDLRAADYLKRLQESSTLNWISEDTESNSVRKSFAISYQEFPNEMVKRAFRILGIFRQQFICGEIVARSLGCSPAQAEQVILTLVRRGLIEVETRKHINILVHPLIRRYAYELLVNAQEERAAHTMAADYYRERLQAWDPQRQKLDFTLLGVVVDIENGLQGALHYQQAELYAQAQEVLVSIADIATLNGREGTLVKHLYELARLTPLVPWLQIYLGSHLITSKSTESAVEGEKILNNLAKSGDTKIASAALICMAKARSMNRQYTEAEGLLHQSRALKESLYPPDLKGLAFIENELAHISLHKGGKHNDALEGHKRAIVLQREASDIKGMAYTLRRIASIQLRHFDQPKEALKTLAEAEELAAGTGATLILVLILLEKADALRRLKYFADAVTNLERAFELAKRCDDPFPEAHVLKRLGLIYENVEFYGYSGNCLERCKKILAEINHVEAAKLEHSIARVQAKIRILEQELDQIGKQMDEAERAGNKVELRVLRRRGKRIRQKLNLEPALIRLGNPGIYTAKGN